MTSNDCGRLRSRRGAGDGTADITDGPATSAAAPTAAPFTNRRRGTRPFFAFIMSPTQPTADVADQAMRT